MRHDVARANLSNAYDCLVSAGVTAFLVDGTLLGAVREGQFLAHDRDIDLGVFEETYTPRAVAAFRRAGFTVHRQYGTRAVGYEISFRRHDVKVDVFLYYLADGFRFHAAWPKRKPPIRYAYVPFELKPIAFCGRDYMAPSPPEDFLERKYGADWRIPVTEWDWRWGPKNAEPWRLSA